MFRALICALLLLSPSFANAQASGGLSFDEPTGMPFSGGTFEGDVTMGDTYKQCFGTDCDYWLLYNSSGTAFEIWTSDKDGGGTNGLVWGISNGTDVVDFTDGITTGGLATFNAGATIPTGQILAFAIDNDAATPSLTLEPGTGFYANGDNTIRLAFAGQARWTWNSSLLQGVVNANSAAISGSNATATVPSLIPGRSDGDTGIGWAGTDQVNAIAGGVDVHHCIEDTIDYCYYPAGVLFDNSAETGITASTTQSQGNGQLTSSLSQVTVVANPNDVVTLTPAKAGRQTFLANAGANVLQVFPSSGDKFAGLATDAPIIIGVGIPVSFLAQDDDTWSTGVGAESSAFSGIWFHNPAELTTTITNAEEFYKITSFDNITEEDVSNNCVGDPATNDDITIGASGAGVYEVTVQASFKATGGVSVNMLIVVGVSLATPIAIASSTDATPIVVTTSAAHGLRNGDMVTIGGHATNVAANGDHFIDAVTSTTFELNTLNNVSVAGSGGGAGSGGNVTIIYPGNILIHRDVSNSAIGRGAGKSNYILYAGDELSAYVANLDSGAEFVASQAEMQVVRFESAL